MIKKHEKNGSASSEATVPTRIERKQVEERIAITARVVYETIRREGDEELHRPAAALAWSALAAGLAMGFSFIAEGLLSSFLPNQPWRQLISRVGYSIGFLIVVLGRQQLFTENTLTAILPLLLEKKWKMLVRVARLWGVVLSGNLVGTLLFAVCIAWFPVFDLSIKQSLMDVAVSHVGSSFGSVFVRAIFAGWLIALMVWLLPAAESAKVSIIVVMTYLITLGGFSHIIAGSTTMFYLVLMKSIHWGTYFTKFFFPTLLGNILGGVSLVAALGHAQVVGGKE
jgi:formate-nitrite transporter family protein